MESMSIESERTGQWDLGEDDIIRHYHPADEWPEESYGIGVLGVLGPRTLQCRDCKAKLSNRESGASAELIREYIYAGRRVPQATGF
jgi:hypothetical protein